MLGACSPESRFYYPSRGAFITPPGVEDIEVRTPDGLRLHAWLLRPPGGTVPPAAPVPGVLHLHGNAGNVEGHAAYSAFLAEHGFAVLVLDYRSYGRSDPARGGLRRADLVTDGKAALDALRTLPGIDPDRIAIFGNSLGGVIGLAVAAERSDVRAVVAIAPFSSWKAISGYHGGALGRLLIPAGLDPVDTVAGLGHRPLLLVHGDADPVVPPSHSAAILAAAERAGVPARLRTVEGAEHNEIVIDDPPLQSEIAQFLTGALGTPPAGR